MSDDLGWWKVVAYPALTASIPGGFVVLQWWINRKDKTTADRQSTTERRDAALLAEREALTKDRLEEDDRLKANLREAYANAAEERAKRIVVDHDRDRGWELARQYYSLARDFKALLISARGTADRLAGQASPLERLPAWTPIDVPETMEPPK